MTKRANARRILLAAAVAWGLFAGAQPARAVAILPTQDARQLVSASARTADGTGPITDETETEQRTLLPFDEFVEENRLIPGSEASASARLVTSITSRRVEAQGQAWSEADSIDAQFARGDGQALFRLEFMVDEPSAFEMILTAVGTGESRVDVYLEEGSEFLELELNSEPGDEQLSYSGVLQPGRFYNLFGFAAAIVSAGEGIPPGRTTAAFGIDFALVPEPSLASLVLAVSAMLLRRHRSLRAP